MFAFVQKNNYIKYNASNTAFYLCNKTRKKREQERKSDVGGGRDTSNWRICKILINSLFFFSMK